MLLRSLNFIVLFGLCANLIEIHAIHRSGLHMLPRRESRMIGNFDKEVEKELQFLNHDKFDHFESKTLIAAQDPDHLNRCWEKCDNTNAVNMKKILSKKLKLSDRLLMDNQDSTTSDSDATNESSMTVTDDFLTSTDDTDPDFTGENPYEPNEEEIIKNLIHGIDSLFNNKSSDEFFLN